jgi:hypothetical protein
MDKIAWFALVGAGGALMSLLSAIFTWIQKRGHRSVQVKTPEGKVTTFNDRMSQEEFAQQLAQITGQVFHKEQAQPGRGHSTDRVQ